MFLFKITLTKNAGFQAAKTEILFKSKNASFQLVEYKSSSDFIRSAYLRKWIAVHLSPF